MNEIIESLRLGLILNGSNNHGYLTIDDNLREKHVFDSKQYVDFIAWIEQKFHIQVPDEVIFSHRFDTLKQMATVIQQLQEKFDD